MTDIPPPGYLDHVAPGDKHSRSLCVCGWVSDRMRTPRDARAAYEIHYLAEHYEQPEN